MAAAFCCNSLGSLPMRLLKGVRVQLGTAEIGVSQIRAVELAPSQISSAQGCAAQAGEAEVSATEISAVQLGPAEVGAHQPGFMQIGIAQLGMNEVDIGQPASATASLLQELKQRFIGLGGTCSKTEQRTKCQRSCHGVDPQRRPVVGWHQQQLSDLSGCIGLGGLRRASLGRMETCRLD